MSTITLENDVINQPILTDPASVTFVFKNKEIPAELTYDAFVSSDGLKFNRKINLLAEAIDHGILLTHRAAKKLYKMEHKGKADSFFENYKLCGDLKCSPRYSLETLSKIERAFSEDTRFRGRIPRISKAMAIVADYYDIDIQPIVENFSIQNTRALLSAGVAEAEVVILYTQLSSQEMAALSASPTHAGAVCKLIEKSLKNGESQFMNAAKWICGHLQTEESIIKKVVKNAKDINLSPDASIDFAKTELSGLKALNEIERIEKRYKECGFKFKNCECHLKFSEIVCGRYKAEILRANDPRQVMLGYDTTCCQHLDGIGESSMMHGLLHPKAGFWVLTNKNSGKVLAQAEVWEENEDTLVFDNIEFANDADIELYKEAIGQWLQESPYRNAKMGVGYNEMVERHMRHCPAVRPEVTPYEIYVISHEEESEAPIFDSEEEAKEALESGRVTYFDYVYCDSENDTVIMKENGIVEPYFAVEHVNRENDVEEELEY